MGVVVHMFSRVVFKKDLYAETEGGGVSNCLRDIVWCMIRGKERYSIYRGRGDGGATPKTEKTELPEERA